MFGLLTAPFALPCPEQHGKGRAQRCGGPPGWETAVCGGDLSRSPQPGSGVWSSAQRVPTAAPLSEGLAHCTFLHLLCGRRVGLCFVWGHLFAQLSPVTLDVAPSQPSSVVPGVAKRADLEPSELECSVSWAPEPARGDGNALPHVAVTEQTQSTGSWRLPITPALPRRCISKKTF